MRSGAAALLAAAATVALVAACGGGSSSTTASGGVDPPDGGTTTADADLPETSHPVTPPPVQGIVVRPTGTVASVQDEPCGAGAPPGATCKHVVVQCPGIAELGATIAIVEPVGPAAASGTVLGLAGGGGNSYYGVGAAELHAQSTLRIVLPKWDGEWEASGEGILAAACRPATLVAWIFDNVHGASRTKAYCATGFSGGSGALAYALAHYGRGEQLDFVALAAGPPFGRIDYGCAPASYAGPPRVLCPLLQDAVMTLPGPTLDAWENTTSCGSASPPPDAVLKWASDSVVSPGAAYDYPKTVVDLFDCTNMPNGTTGGAFFYASAITSKHAVFCFDGPNDGCSGEGLGKGKDTLVSELIAGCIPRH